MVLNEDIKDSTSATEYEEHEAMLRGVSNRLLDETDGVEGRDFGPRYSNKSSVLFKESSFGSGEPDEIDGGEGIESKYFSDGGVEIVSESIIFRTLFLKLETLDVSDVFPFFKK